MRKTDLAAALTMVAMLNVPVPATAQDLYNGFRRIDPMGVDRPPGPVPNARQGHRRVYRPMEGNYPSCTGFKWLGDRCRLPTGQLCIVYEHGLDNCI
jgi:hypothetical protein